MRRRNVLAISLVALFLHLQVAVSQTPMPKLVTAVEGIAEYRLENGMRVLLFPDPTKETVTVNNTIFVGSRHEGYGEAGMAHLLEHMLFKGTPTFEDIPKLLKDRGARMNGTTSLDRTNYYETMRATPDNLEFAIKLEADRMINSLIRGEDLASEMTVVRNEFERGENSPFRVLQQRITSAAFDWHNYGQSTIGNRADIERVPVENLRAFYRKYYQPDNALLIVSGSFSPDRTLALIQKYFGAIPRPARKLNATYTEEPIQDGERTITVRRVGDVALVGVAYHVVSGPHPDFAALDILATSVAQAPSGRLYKALVETSMAASVGGGVRATHDPNVCTFLAEVVSGVDPQEVADAMIDVLENLKDKPLTEEEIQRSRSELLNGWEQQFSDVKRSARDQPFAVSLSNWAAQGDWRLWFLYRDRLENAKPKDIARQAGAFFTRTNRTLGFFRPTEEPTRATIPSAPDLATMLSDYKGREAVSAGESFDVSPANIESRARRSELNGVQVTLLPKKTRGGVVSLQLSLRFGNLESLTNKEGIPQLLGGMLRRGTKDYTRQQITDKLNEFRSELSFSSGSSTLSCVIKTKREQLIPVLSILGEVLANPTFPSAELATLKQSRIASLEQQLSDPTALAQLDVIRRIRPFETGDPRYVSSPQEQIEAIRGVSAEDLAEFYRDQLTGQHGELTVVGDFDNDAMLSAIEPILGQFAGKVAYERIASPAVDVPAGFVAINTPEKANATYFAACTFPLRDDAVDAAALMIGNRILGGGLSSRLGNRVRQKEGLSYTVGSQLQSSSFDQNSVFSVFAICNPENVPKVRLAIDEELKLIRKDGITQEELADAVKSYVDSGAAGRVDDMNLVGLLGSHAHAGRTMQFTADREQQVQELTVADVNAAIRKYLDPEKLVIAVGADQAKIPE